MSLKEIAPEKPVFKNVAKFWLLADDRCAKLAVQKVHQCKMSREAIDEFEERRTELERAAGDRFETVDGYCVLTPEQQVAVVSKGLAGALGSGKQVTFYASPYECTSHQGEEGQVVRCRVSIGTVGRHHKVFGEKADGTLRWTLDDLRGAMPAFIIEYKRVSM